ncbi:hypothetical protein [Streptomyces griseiscabiei]|uniref:Secreted protein n=1 Tax=Streptomyces griseiscabiei TaxID=2993540 RepID=A0ABU4L455_9ACTN|nr:hypothetical protein [Streptomyces griseiscabiei]MBZ3901466.1 hypothetical protein [Streptomyces griseiscabiei]MDX2909984.1 hypothetical protein [Streptomyces griseiscabiei]
MSRRTFAGVSAAAAAVLIVTATSASAETVPTEQQLLSQCHKADYCKFTPSSLEEGVGSEHQVGSTTFNCGAKVHRSWTYSETTSQSTNAQISLSLSESLLETASISITETLGRTFEKSHTWSETYDQDMAPFTKVWVTRGTGLQIAEGDWELHFPSRFFGHYYWYDKGYQIKVEDPDRGFVSLHYKTLTDQEINQHCPGERPAPNRTTFSSTRSLKGFGSQNASITGWEHVRDRGVFQGDSHSSS